MTINQVSFLATGLISNHSELMFWSFVFHNKKSSFGTCNHKKREIQISSLLFPVMSDEAIRDTILHEIAHALTRGHHHDYVWKSKCRELGCNSNSVGVNEMFKDGKDGHDEFRKATSKYTLICPTCGKEFYKNRAPKYDSSCNNHGKGYNSTHKLVLTQNY